MSLRLIRLGLSAGSEACWFLGRFLDTANFAFGCCVAGSSRDKYLWFASYCGASSDTYSCLSVN